MISLEHPLPGEEGLKRRRRRRDAALEAKEAELRFCVLTQPSGRVEIRYFRSPHDVEGVSLTLSPREREELAFALADPGFHAVHRDDSPENQLQIAFTDLPTGKEADET